VLGAGLVCLRDIEGNAANHMTHPTGITRPTAHGSPDRVQLHRCNRVHRVSPLAQGAFSPSGSSIWAAGSSHPPPTRRLTFLSTLCPLTPPPLPPTPLHPPGTAHFRTGAALDRLAIAATDTAPPDLRMQRQHPDREDKAGHHLLAQVL
jgi:hypothetical protein